MPGEEKVYRGTLLMCTAVLIPVNRLRHRQKRSKIRLVLDNLRNLWLQSLYRFADAIGARTWQKRILRRINAEMKE